MSNCPFLNFEVILAALEQAVIQTAPHPDGGIGLPVDRQLLWPAT
ncbi:MAG: hypothetical protein Q8Q28_02265 [Pseudomonadota bacterium]|nr:hypothetical protein [Pseudomonadota bacterium]